MKILEPVNNSVPTTLPLHEHKARRRRGTVPTPGKTDGPRSAPHTPDHRTAADADSLVSTYRQFSPQGALHQ